MGTKKLIKCTYFALVALAATSTWAAPDYRHLATGTLVRPSSDVRVPGRAKTNYLVNRLAFQPAAGFPAGLHPSDLYKSYNAKSDGGSGAIAVVVAFNLPSALQDFNTFANQFGLPKEPSLVATASTNKVFQVVYAAGAKPADNAGWGGEAAMDIQWTHAMAPKAKIYLVEAATNGYEDMTAAERLAASLPGVRQVSNSWGSTEFPTEQIHDSSFVRPGVVFFASSGDDGGVSSYPAMSPNVVGVGGTRLVVSSSGDLVSETAWAGSGGGPSPYIARPPYQNVITAILGTKRGSPDIAAVADPFTGGAVYSSYAFGGWAVLGGTSLACPIVAGIANSRQAWLNSSAEENARNYSRLGTSSFRDVVAGTAGAFTAKVGWDFITGCGVPYGPLATPVSYLPGTVTTFYGTNPLGTTGSLANLDFSYYSVDSVAIPPYGLSAGFQTTFPTGVTDPTKMLDLSVSLNASSTTNNTTIQVHAWDWTKNAWVFVRSFPGGPVYKTFSTLMPAGNFVGTGTVKLAVRGIVPPSVPVTSFRLSVDQVKLGGSLLP